MTIPLEMLYYCSTIKRERYKLHVDLAQLPLGSADMTQIHAGIRQAVKDRLDFALRLLNFAEGLRPADGSAMDDMAARNALSRAYYVAHHTLRALLLFEEHGDIDGHYEVIKAVCNRVESVPALKTLLGSDSRQLNKELSRLIHQRHLADYYPYGMSQIGEAVLDFEANAEVSLKLARRLLGRYI